MKRLVVFGLVALLAACGSDEDDVVAGPVLAAGSRFDGQSLTHNMWVR